MMKLSVVFLTVLLLTLQISTQMTQAVSTTKPPSGNITTSSPTGGCGSAGAPALMLVPLALAALLNGWSG